MKSVDLQVEYKVMEELLLYILMKAHYIRMLQVSAYSGLSF